MSRKFQPCSLTLNGHPVAEGTVMTGADAYGWVLQNGLVRITKPDLAPDPIEGGLTMERWDASTSTWLDCFGAQYGDWCFFASPLQNRPTSATAVKVDHDEIILAIEWAPHPLNTGYLALGGVLDRDWTGAANYDNGGSFKIITSLDSFTKTIRLKRGREGYFVGYHSVPNISPKNGMDGNNETGYGEREAGTGGNNAVFFASSGFAARHPEWGANSNWGGGSDYSTQRHAWARIDDPNTSAPYITPSYIAYQNALDTAHTFPAEQTTGPWWVADINANNWTVCKVVKYIAFFDRLEVASWQFSAGAYGQTVVHFVNELIDEDTGDTAPYQLFIGAFPYTSPYDMTTSGGRANEPTASLRAKVTDRCPLDFDETGIAQDDEPETTTTAGQIRDLMIRTVRGLTPTVAAERGFEPYREDAGPIRRWADKTPIAAPRRFSVRDVGEVQPPTASDTEVAWVQTEFEVVVSYPYGHGWGSLAALSLDDVIELDAKQIEGAIGTDGYLMLDTSNGGEACVSTLATYREDGDACRFLVIRLSVQFWRSYS